MQRLLEMSPEERDVFFMDIDLPELIGACRRPLLATFKKQDLLMLEKNGQLYAVVMARLLLDHRFYQRSFSLLRQLADLYDRDIQVFCLSYQLHFYPAIKGQGLYSCLAFKRQS